MFIVDTVDAAYPPENWTPQAVMDRLGEIINKRGDLVNTGPRASISLLNTKNGPQARKTQENLDDGDGDTLSSVPMSAMAQRKSFSGESTTVNGEPSFFTAEQQRYQEALSQAGIPYNLPLTSLRKPSIKPLLFSIRQSKITSLAALEPFFSRASLANYEAVYSLGVVDWEAVERSLEADLFEGDE